MTTPEHIAYPLLASRYHRVFLSYLESGLPECFKHDFRSASDVRHKARNAAQQQMDASVVRALLRYNKECGAPGPVLENIHKLEEGMSAVVIAGQQPGLATGPLFTIYKAVTVLRLSRWLSEASGIPCIPMFWNHSDDHDVSEINETALFKPGSGLTSVRLGLTSGRTPFYEIRSARAVDAVIRSIDGLLPPTEHKDSVMKLLKRTRHERPALWFSRIMMALFGPHGLVLVEPHVLDGSQAQSVFEKAMGDPSAMRKALDAGRETVTRLGLPDQLGPESGLQIYRISGKRRQPVSGSKPGRGRLSAGVALRLMVQDTVLPTAAVVMGPNELAYGAELGPLYGHFDLDPPVFFPRISATVVEPRIRKIMSRLDLRLEDVLNPREAPERPQDRKNVKRIEEGIQSARRAWEESVVKIEQIVGGDRPEVRSARKKTLQKIDEALMAYRSRLLSIQGQDAAISKGHEDKLHDHLLPGGELQERRLNVLHFLTHYGMNWLDGVVTHADPLTFAHQIFDVV